MSTHTPPKTLQAVISALSTYWSGEGCVLMQPLDMEVGAGTFHTASFLGAIGPEPWYAAYVQPSRRPTDGRYGDNPNRVGRHHQYQVILKPSPLNIQTLYLNSLNYLGIDLLVDEVWLNGKEVTQFNYFQQVGGLSCQPVTVEMTYGLERLAMSLQDVDNVYDL